MNFGRAIAAGYSREIFPGRSARSEYWYWVLFTVLGSIVAGIIDLALSEPVIDALFGLATILPSLAVAVRRLHDLDRTGWWIFIGLIPLIGWIILIIWYCTRGTVGPNRFGPDPLGG